MSRKTFLYVGLALMATMVGCAVSVDVREEKPCACKRCKNCPCVHCKTGCCGCTSGKKCCDACVCCK